MPGRMLGYAKPKTTSSSLNWHVTTATWRKPAFTHHKQPKKGLKSALLELGLEPPPHTHVLNDLTRRLKGTGLETKDLEALSLRSLSRMAIQSRYPVDATPPSELFDPEETDQALATAREVLSILRALDQQG